MKKRFHTLLVTASLAILSSCTAYKNLPSKVDNSKLIPFTQALMKKYNILLRDMPHYQFFLGPDGFELNRDVDIASSKVGPGGKIILTDKQGVNHIDGKPFTPLVFIHPIKISDSVIDFKMDLGPIVDKKGKIYYQNTYLVFGPSSADPSGAYVLYAIKRNKKEIINVGKDVFNLTFTGDGLTMLYVDPKMIENAGDELMFKGKKVTK